MNKTPEMIEEKIRFINLWNAADSTDEVAKKLGISRETASKRASILRINGAAIKHMPYPTLGLSVDGRLQKVVGLTPEEFVEAWQSSISIEDMVKKCRGADRTSIMHRVQRYRRMGVPLRKLPGEGIRGATLNVKKLAKLAKKIR